MYPIGRVVVDATGRSASHDIAPAQGAGDVRRKEFLPAVDLMASLHEHRRRAWCGAVLCRRAGAEGEVQASCGPVQMCESIHLKLEQANE
jgi:hypothetical protein